MSHETIKEVSDVDDRCEQALAAQAGAEHCLWAADALPDGAPEQVSVLLRGLLAAQLGIIEMMVSITEKLDAWPETHGGLARSHWSALSRGRPVRVRVTDPARSTPRRYSDHVVRPGVSAVLPGLPLPAGRPGGRHTHLTRGAFVAQRPSEGRESILPPAVTDRATPPRPAARPT